MPSKQSLSSQIINIQYSHTMTLLQKLRSYIDMWEYSWVEILDENKEGRKQLVILIRAFSETHKNSDVFHELQPWLKAFENSLIEQTKYEAWNEERSKYFYNPEKMAELIAQRDALLQPYIDNEQHDLAPDWLFSHFNPRLGPAMGSIKIMDESAVLKKHVFLIPLAEKLFSR